MVLLGMLLTGIAMLSQSNGLNVSKSEILVVAILHPYNLM